MVAKTFQGLEEVLATELRNLGAGDVTPGNRMVAFTGDLAMLYRANMCCRTALRILKPFVKFKARDAEDLYDKAKAFDWTTIMNASQTFAIDTVAFSEEFRHTQYATYKVKDAIMDFFSDKFGADKRPRVRLDGADLMINVHISGSEVTLSLDSSGESLHRRGYRRAQTEAPINEVLAAGIILLSGWDGTTPFVDPMCGSGTFVIEAALIAAGINPGVFRQHYSFENWADFDRELFEEIYNDDSGEREITVPIIGADISPKAIDVATLNAKSAGVARSIKFEVKSIAKWTEAPKPAGIMITNPPYGKRISAEDMNGLYSTIGTVLKRTFTGYHSWIIGYKDEYFHEIGLAPSQKVAINNGGLDCELREYVIFEGSKRDFRAAGGKIKEDKSAERRKNTDRKASDRRDRRERPGERFERAFRRDDERRGSRREKEDTPRERKPYRLPKEERKPMLPPESAIDMRPTWRARKIKNTDNTNE